MKVLKRFFKFENIFLLFYIVFTFVLMLYHEPWRDEAQSWLIARDLNIIDIFMQMKYEGHPSLWYLILVPFAKMGFSFKFVNIISWIFGCLSSVIIVKRSSCNKYVKFFLLVSPIFLYYCNILGRSYCLCLFLILLLSIFYNDRENRPITYSIILFLCANTHILLLGFVCAVILVDIYDLIIKKSSYNRKNRLICLGISISGLIVVFLQLVGCIGLNREVSVSTSSIILDNYSIFFKKIFLEWGGVVNIFFILGILYFMFREKKLLFIFLVSILFEIFVFIYIYKVKDYMISLFYLVFIFCSLVFLNKIGKKDKDYKKVNVLLVLVFVTFIPLSLNLVINEFKYVYSDSLNVSKYIDDNIDSSDNILCVSDASCSAIVPYISFDYKFVSLFTGDSFTYVNWGIDRSDIVDISNAIITNDIGYVIHSYGINGYFDLQVMNLKNNGYLEVVYDSDSSVITNDKYEVLRVIK